MTRIIIIFVTLPNYWALATGNSNEKNNKTETLSQIFVVVQLMKFMVTSLLVAWMGHYYEICLEI